jgi:hypothetical protein
LIIPPACPRTQTRLMPKQIFQHQKLAVALGHSLFDPNPETLARRQSGGPAPWGSSAEKARLVGWAERAASTTFSATGLKSGYDKQEVDAFRSAIRDTFLGVSKPPWDQMTSVASSSRPNALAMTRQRLTRSS